MNLAQHMIEHAALGVTPGGAAPALAVPGLFVKASPLSPAFAKTAAGALSVKAGTVIGVADQVLRIDVDTSVAMPALVAGTDYAIYACTDGAAARIEWEYAQEVRRDSPLVMGLAPLLSLSDEQLDSLFRVAGMM